MRTSKFFLPMVLLLFSISFLAGCNSDKVVTSSETKQHFVSAHVLDAVTWLRVREYVRIDNSESEASVFEFRNLAYFERGGLPGIDTSSFTTPDSIRTEGANTVTTLGYSLVYYVRWWGPASYSNRGFWEAKGRQAPFTPIYLRVQSPNFNSNAGGWGDSLTSVQIPKNKNIKVSWGVDYVNDKDEYYYYDLGNEY